jgi:hypothetical protein
MGLNEIRKIKQEAGKPKPKKLYDLRKATAEKAARNKQAKEKPPERSELDIWFEGIKIKHWGNKPFIHCMECNDLIPSELARHATAHLLAKKLFHSVETHPLNYLILCTANGCHDKTHRIDRFVKMKVWPEASNRIKQMIPFLHYDELKSLSYDLLKALEKT